jgi:hypothetical protein
MSVAAAQALGYDGTTLKLRKVANAYTGSITMGVKR